MRTILLLAAGWLSGAAVTAQTTPAPALRTRVERQQFTADTPPEPMARLLAEQLKGQLSLSPAQTTRVYAAALARRQAYQTMLRRRQAPGTYEPIEQEEQAIKAAYEARLKPILTPAQAARYQVIQARYRKLMAQYQAGEKAKK